MYYNAFRIASSSRRQLESSFVAREVNETHVQISIANCEYKGALSSLTLPARCLNY